MISLDTCIGEAKRSNLLFKVGASLYYGNKLVCSGRNRGTPGIKVGKKYLSRPLEIASPVGIILTIHAEEDCILRYRRKGGDPKGCTMIVVRVNRNGELRNAKPCSRCHAIIKAYGIKTVFYSTEHGMNKL